MSKIYKLYLVAVFLFTTLLNSYSQENQSYSLGKSSDMFSDVSDQMSSGLMKSSAKPFINLKVSDNQNFDVRVNLKKSLTNSHYLAGEVVGHEGGSFFINVDQNSLNGNIVLKGEKKAYQYFSDASGNAYIKSIDINKILCVEYGAQQASTTTTTTSAPISAAVANLQSYPGANGCILLDFDGQYVSGTPWNNGNPINAASSGMSDDQIQQAWELISEDYRPFNINITTSESVFNSYPQNRRMRCIFTPTNTAAPGAGGVAYVGSFSWNDNTPCWVFILDGKNGGEAASHEIGHTLGLSHDGRELPTGHEEYYGGQGDWAPIMGVGYYKNITQWSKGEYQYANNHEDDLAIISGSNNGLGFRNDDYSNSTGNAANLGSGNVSKSGLIERNSDIDYFLINSGSGTISLSINTVSRFGDLDILVKLYNASGQVIGTYNPSGLNSSLSAGVSQGTYYLSVQGIGAGDPYTNGYSNYASLGTYTISGTVPTPVNNSGVATFYKDCNYGGYAVSLPAGDYNMNDLIARGIQNDDISSIKVNSGYEVQLFWDYGFTGSSVVVSSDNSCLVGIGWNDQVTSLKVRAKTSFSTLLQAESYSNMAGVQTESTTDAGGGLDVGWIDAGDWMAYSNITFPYTGTYIVEYRVASLAGGGRLSCDLNAGSIQLGQIDVPNTGGWQNWTTITQTVTINAGTYNFGIYAQAGGWNLNWFRITKQGSAKISASNITTDDVNAAGLEVYPNPVMGQLNLKYSTDLSGEQIRILNASGVEVMNTTSSGDGIDVSSLNSGIYMVVINKNGRLVTTRFVKN